MIDFGPGVGDQALPQEDDFATGPIPLNPPFQFYGEFQDRLYISTNGILSFESSFLDCCPRPFPFSSPPLIASFWQDVDITRSGNIYYRVENSIELLQGVAGAINAAVTFNPSIFGVSPPFTPAYVVVATWDSVAAFNRSVNGTNTFQTLLATDGFSSYVVLTYGDMQWPDGAVIGFNDGGDGTSANLLASVEDRRSADVVTGTNVPNLGFSGLYIYRVNDLSRVPRSGSGSGSGSGGGFPSGSGSGCVDGDAIQTQETYRSGDTERVFLFLPQLCVGGVYGAICDQGWDDRDARVACIVAGYPPPIFGTYYNLLSDSLFNP